MFVMRWIILGILLACSAVGAPAASVFVSGTVVERDSQEPIGGARVSVFPAQSTSGTPVAGSIALANGTFLFRVSSEGSYRVRVECPDYMTVDQTLAVPRAGLHNVKLAIASPPGFHLDLRKPDGARVRAGDSVEVESWLLSTDGGLVQTSEFRTGRGGSLFVALPNELPPAKIKGFYLMIRDPVIGWGEARSTGFPTARLPMTLQPGSSIHGRAPDRVALDPYVFCARLPRDKWPLQASGFPGQIDRDSHFEFDNLPQGRYQIMVWYRKAASSFVTYAETTITGKEPSIDIGTVDQSPAGVDLWRPTGTVPLAEILDEVAPERTAASISVTGMVYDAATHDPLENAVVLLYPDPNATPAASYAPTGLAGNAGSEVVDAARTGPDGVYHLRALQPGAYRLSVRPNRYGIVSSGDRKVNITPAGLKNQDLAVAAHPATGR